MRTTLRELMEQGADRARTPAYDAVARAQRLGERRRRRRRLVAGCASLVAVAGVVLAANFVVGRPDSAAPVAAATTPAQASPGPAFPSGCTMEDLPLPAGYTGMAIVTAGDPTGRFVVGRSYPTGGGPRMLIWERDNATDGYQVTLADMPGSDSMLFAVNGGGSAVGFTFPDRDDVDHTAAYVYHDGAMTLLPGGDTTQATGIGEDGSIIGSVAGEGLVRVPVVWRTPTSAPEFLTLPAEMPYGQAVAVRDDGSIVGMVSRAPLWVSISDFARPVIWRSDGTMTMLDWPAGLLDQHGQPATFFGMLQARGDWAVIWAGDRDGWIRHLWNMSTGEVRYDVGLIWGLNAQGWYLSGALVSDQGTVSLGDAQAVAVSDDGRTIAGYRGTGESSTSAVVWRCS